MNAKFILRRLGLIKTPEYTVSLAANNPFTGTFYTVRFSDGKTGMITDRHNGTYKAIPTYIKDGKKAFVSVSDAAESIYSELIRTGEKNFLNSLEKI